MELTLKQHRYMMAVFIIAVYNMMYLVYLDWDNLPLGRSIASYISLAFNTILFTTSGFIATYATPDCRGCEHSNEENEKDGKDVC